MTTPAAVTPAPAADPAAPTTPVVAPTTAPASTSLLPETPPAAPVEPTTPVTPTTPAAVVSPTTPTLIPANTNGNDAEWFLAPNVKGTGTMPEWFKADKYKSVDEQAKAYSALEKRLGAFTGAPADGKYTLTKLPEGINPEAVDTEHPTFKALAEQASKMQISNEAFGQLIGTWMQYEAQLVPNPAANLAAAKSALGETADSRIAAVASWVHANLGKEGYEQFRTAVDASQFNGQQIATVFSLMESAINKTRVQMPKPGDDVPGAHQNAQSELRVLEQKKGPDGQFLIFSDPKHRALVNAKREEIAKAQMPK